MDTTSPNVTFGTDADEAFTLSHNAFVPMLESFVPGISLVTGIFSSYFKIDITQYFLSLLLLLGIATGLQHCVKSLWDVVGRYLLSTAEIRCDDMLYDQLMYWISKQSFSDKTTKFVAETFWGSYNDSDDDDDDDDDGENSLGSEDEEWDNSENQVTNRYQMRELQFTPARGTHYFRYAGSLLTFKRRAEDTQNWFSRSKTETIYISCFGRNPRILKNLLKQAQIAYYERDGNRTVIYRAGKKIGEEYTFSRCLSRAPRPMSSVVLDQHQKNEIIRDMKEYLHPYTRRWYSNRGIPYRRGYLFYGPPGTGKTSLCFSLAGLLGLRIYVISLNSPNMTEDALANLFRDLPWKCIVLLEDIDSAGITAKREDKKVETPAESTTSSTTTVEGSNPDNPQGITLSGLLNVLDGISSSEGRVLCMTTNHKNNLDPALLRPGRVDMMVHFGYADKPTIEGIYQSIFFNQEARLKQYKANGYIKAPSSGSTLNGPTTQALCTQRTGPPKYQNGRVEVETKDGLKEDKHGSYFRHHDKTDAQIAEMAVEFAEKMPADEFSPAELQGYLLKHKKSPQAALDNIDDFVIEIRAEKAERERAEAKVKEDNKKAKDEAKAKASDEKETKTEKEEKAKTLEDEKTKSKEGEKSGDGDQAKT